MAIEIEAPKQYDVAPLRENLTNKTLPMHQRFRSVFTLRNLGGKEAIDALVAGLDDPSCLLKHEIAFVLGQMQDPYAIPFLVDVLKNVNEDSMVRHEAGEALGAIGRPDVLPILEQYAKDPSIEVAETCQLAVARIQWQTKHLAQKAETDGSSKYDSVDPAPPSRRQKTVPELRTVLLNAALPLFKRYRAMFSLRNIDTRESALALAEGLHDESALFRHEIAYVLGQMQNEAAAEALAKSLEQDDHKMVRHEAAEALGAIAAPSSLPTLRQYAKDKEDVVRESCEVALDVHEYFQSGEFEYADMSHVAAAKKEEEHKP